MKSRQLFALVGGLVLLAAACSSSSKTPTASAPATTAAAGASATTSAGAATGGSTADYVIGNIGTYSGPVSGDYGSDRQTLTAWADYTNDNGGINGHKVKVIALDDQGNPTVALQDAQQLVQQDHVLAVVDDNTNGGTSYGTYLQQQGVPLIGATSNPPAATDDLYFPVGGGTLEITFGEVEAAAKIVHSNKIAFVYCAEAAVCAQAVPLIKADSAANGITVSYVSAAPETAPSYTPYCLSAKQNGAQAILPGLASPAAIAIAQACTQQGYHPTFLVGGAPVGPTFAQTSAMDGAIGVEGVFPWTLNSTPATQAFHNALQKYEPAVLTSKTYNSTTANSWADAQMFAAGAKVMQGNSPAALVTALQSLQNVDLGGLIAPESFQAGKQTKAPCFSYLKLQGGQWTPLNNGAFTCPPPS